MTRQFGWKRKVVHRAKGTGIDIYYRAQDNKKLRSTRKVHEYLDPRSRLKIHHFTFARKPLGLDCSKEVCRHVRNPGVPDDAINIIEEQTVGLDIEEQNPIDIQPKVVNSCDSAAIDNNKIEEKLWRLILLKKSPKMYNQTLSHKYCKSPESDENSSSETTMFHECKGRRFQFKKGSDIDNQATIAFINDFIMKNHNATWFYSDNETFTNDGTKEEIVNNHNGAAIDKNKIGEQTIKFNIEE
ncbi:Methyl-CpG DNA binding,DNA-binding domain [Cinara cedri]|uniref:Methyl-CpG DNA binding,DNA-binding domain n=1 Tax=Cinara cedri TaxID=506608 RepID=A0A5E4NAI5_9HEMI|nr:Methyl-CpG DNA binding,DNA-binding domain [Cinara cedri]